MLNTSEVWFSLETLFVSAVDFYWKGFPGEPATADGSINIFWFKIRSFHIILKFVNSDY